MRLLLLVLLLATGPLAGCLGGDEPEEDVRLAKPTDRPPSVPPLTPVAPRGANLTDPGYRVTGAWRVGDGWDYESNASRVLRIRVIEERTVGDAKHYLVEERLGTPGQPGATANRSWVDGSIWGRMNTTYATGGGERYHPGQPLRLYRNLTVQYNVTAHDAAGRALDEKAVTLVLRLRPQHQTLLFPWGYVEARVVEENATARRAGGGVGFENATRWVHADYLNDLQFQLPGGETFKLTAVRAGDFRRGTLAP